MHWRKLVVLAAFFCGPPLVAHERPPAASDRAQPQPQTRCGKPTSHAAGCPRGRRSKETLGGVSFPPAEYPPAENFLFDNGRRPPNYMP